MMRVRMIRPREASANTSRRRRRPHEESVSPVRRVGPRTGAIRQSRPLQRQKMGQKTSDISCTVNRHCLRPRATLKYKRPCEDSVPLVRRAGPTTGAVRQSRPRQRRDSSRQTSVISCSTKRHCVRGRAPLKYKSRVQSLSPPRYKPRTKERSRSRTIRNRKQMMLARYTQHLVKSGINDLDQKVTPNVPGPSGDVTPKPNTVTEDVVHKDAFYEVRGTNTKEQISKQSKEKVLKPRSKMRRILDSLRRHGSRVVSSINSCLRAQKEE